MDIKALWNQRKTAFYLSIPVFTVNFIVDRITKILAIRYLKDSPPITFLNDLMVLTYAENTGAFLSMGSQWHPAFKYAALLILPIAVCLYGIYWCLFKEKNTVRIILIMTIIGGGLNNLIDRLINNFTVTDFLNFGIGSIRTGVLNVADLSVTFGAIGLIIFELRQGRKTTSPEK